MFVKNLIKSLVKGESGQGFTEYGLLIAVIALGITATLVAFRTQLISVFSAISGTLGGTHS